MYLFVILKLDQPTMIKIGVEIAAAYVGMQLPLMLLKNKIQRRQLSIKRAFPDTLDLLLICVESGMSIEAVFRKVSDEVGLNPSRWPRSSRLRPRSCPICWIAARPMKTPRQAHGPRRRQIRLYGLAAGRTVTALLLATMLRVAMAQENRDMRMSEAEKKAAGLPPKLTVP